MKIVLSQPISRSENIDQNFETVLTAADQMEDTLAGADMLVLPELIGATSSAEDYENWVKLVAETLNCCVVGGSHHERGGTSVLNCGIVVNAEGAVIARYDKHRPYGAERDRGVAGGTTWGQFTLDGRYFLVLICSDFWYSASFFGLDKSPDVVLTPSFSVTQKPDPAASRNLWKHMAVSRAYEFATYVGVSDWAHPCEYLGLRSCGVAGLANPLPDDEHFFIPVGDSAFKRYELCFDRLDELRENRRLRDFLCQPQWIR